MNDEPDVMAGAAKHSMHGIAQCSFKSITPQLAVALHMADGGFNSAAALGHRLAAARDAASPA